MKASLPDGHCLPQSVIDSEFVTRDGAACLTDVQFEALAAGVAAGTNLLVTAPTSSGKTGVATFAISGWLSTRQAGRGQAVYLLSHRALAREKFIEFRDRLAPMLGVGPEEIVFAIGDLMFDGYGDDVAEPLSATILVATYEKYLGLVSASGTPSDLSHTCFVLDEFQLIGDEHRGQDVEILVTLLRRARAGQIVALCAMLDPADGRDVADWLGAKEVRISTREVELLYELRLPGETFHVSTNNAEQLLQAPAAACTTTSILKELLADPAKHSPIAVFCTSRRQVFDLAKEWNAIASPAARQLSFVFDEETASSRELVSYLPKAFAFHTADLVETEREAVEDALRDSSLQVVFATTTLAFGLNFSFKTVVIHQWERTVDRITQPIPAAEFHNMAGRAGRLSLAESGRAIFTATAPGKRKAMSYLELSRVERIASRIRLERFDQLALQLLSAGLVTDRDGLVEFLNATLSAVRESRRDMSFERRWREAIDKAIGRLQEWRFINAQLAVTPVGRKIAASGVSPASAHCLLDYLKRGALTLDGALSDKSIAADTVEFALIHACLCSPDFTRSQGGRRTIPWQIKELRGSVRAQNLESLLIRKPWRLDALAAVSADLAIDWMAGHPIVSLENRFDQLRGGDLDRMFADLSQMLIGWADIATAATAPSLHPEDRAASLPDPDSVRDPIRQLASVMRTAGRRVALGVPERALWLAEITGPDGRKILSRTATLALALSAITGLDTVLDGQRKTEMIAALRPAYGTQKAPGKVEALRDAAQRYRIDETERRKNSQIRRAGREWEDILLRIYSAPGTAFEDAVNDAFVKLGVNVVARDVAGKIRFPDFVLDLPGIGTLILECKAKDDASACVDIGTATDIGGKATSNGYDDAYKVTLCRPYIGPDVHRSLNSKRLAVINCEEFAEVIVRMAVGKANIEDLADWLAQPGVVTLESFGGASGAKALLAN